VKVHFGIILCVLSSFVVVSMQAGDEQIPVINAQAQILFDRGHYQAASALDSLISRVHDLKMLYKMTSTVIRVTKDFENEIQEEQKRQQEARPWWKKWLG
jgi:hypothetical protein